MIVGKHKTVLLNEFEIEVEDTPVTDAEKKDLVLNFATGIKTKDRALLESLATEDVFWSLPGDNLMSRPSKGVDGILEHGATLEAFEVNVQVEHVVYGADTIGIILHNTGTKNGRVLDMHLTTVFQLRDGKVHRLNTLLHDVSMMNNYFV